MPNCETCKEKKEPLTVPYVVHEAEMARSERHIKRLWIALVVTVCLMFASNAFWLYEWCQYDYSAIDTFVEQDAQDGGNANYIGNDGDILNGLSKSDSTETNP